MNKKTLFILLLCTYPLTTHTATEQPQPTLPGLYIVPPKTEQTRYVSVKELLKERNITSIPENGVLDLTGNDKIKINDLKGLQDLKNLNRLKVLNLGGNALKNLPEEEFKWMFGLQELSLFGNKLQEFPVGLVYRLTELKSLDLRYNKDLKKIGIDPKFYKGNDLKNLFDTLAAQVTIHAGASK